MDPRTEPFALLDDAQASDRAPTSRLYQDLVHQRVCTDPATLDAVWAQVRADLAAGLHAVLLADYEWGARLIGAPHAPPRDDEPPALRVLLFRRLRRCSADQVQDWLAAHDDGQPAGTTALQPSVDDAGFDAAIGAIHQAITEGQTYQVNYTYRLSGAAWGDPLALYRRLRAHQPVPHGALIHLPALPPGQPGATAVRWVLSRSPELFVRQHGGTVTARPMKGTARRVAEPLGDSETARELAGDTKNRAENLMIVDLLRNDLGRVARTGSVTVPELFRIEPYATVFQMTSTVQATLADGVTVPQLLRAVFPCGSITGAPKHHTMGLIRQLEGTPRGLYCGAIGWVDAPAAGSAAPQCEDLCLSVAIRTLTLGESRDGLRPLRLGVGAGIVQDSVAADERAECRLKARFLTGLTPGFELFETLLAEPWFGISRLDAHLDRLADSARALGFACDIDAARAELVAAVADIRQPTRLRLALAHDGRRQLRSVPLVPLSPRPGTAAEPVWLWLADARRPDPRRQPPWLSAHKTTWRADYDAGVQLAEQHGAFDSLFFTADGRLVEGGRSNVFLRLDGRWYTPPSAH